MATLHYKNVSPEAISLPNIGRVMPNEIFESNHEIANGALVVVDESVETPANEPALKDIPKKKHK